MERRGLMFNVKCKKYIFVIAIFAICTLLIATIFTVCKKDEVVRVAIGEGLEYYLILYENGDLIVEHGWAKHGDISKKPYIYKKLKGFEDFDLYDHAETKLSTEDLERIKELAKAVDYCPNDLSPVSDVVCVKFYYEGRAVRRNSLSDTPPTVKQLVKELMELSPIPIHLPAGA